VNKAQLIDAVAEGSGLSKADSARAVEATLDTVMSALASGDSVALVNFGTFGVKNRAARTGRDPRTGGVLQIPAATVAFFKPGKAMKDGVNAGGAVAKGEEKTGTKS
jgi:DNA-binding protein HU-beta